MVSGYVVLFVFSAEAEVSVVLVVEVVSSAGEEVDAFEQAASSSNRRLRAATMPMVLDVNFIK